MEALEAKIEEKEANETEKLELYRTALVAYEKQWHNGREKQKRTTVSGEEVEKLIESIILNKPKSLAVAEHIEEDTLTNSAQDEVVNMGMQTSQAITHFKGKNDHQNNRTESVRISLKTINGKRKWEIEEEMEEGPETETAQENRQRRISSCSSDNSEIICLHQALNIIRSWSK